MPVLAPLGRAGLVQQQQQQQRGRGVRGRVPPPAAALRCPGPGKAPRGGGSRTRDPPVWSFCLRPGSLCFFDKNLKEERDGIRELSRAGVGRC